MLRFLLKKNNYSFSSQQITDYVRRGKLRPQCKIQIGQKLYDFELQSKQYFRDFDLTYNKYKHRQFDTNFHQLQCSQQTNTFCLIIPTQSLQKPGLNLALQKMLISGSRHYPIRNLLKEVKQKSFNNIQYPTTVNQDYMMFGFSTPLMKDFQNLLEVYSDMIFQPLLRQQDFQQTIWRFHLDNNRKLNFAGQLVQELKNQQYYQENFMYQQIMKQLFNQKNLTICSPEQLMNVKYSDLVRFYKEKFTLSNIKLINHGDMNAQWILSKWQSIVDKKKIKSYKAIINREQQGEKSIKLPKTILFEHVKPQTILLYSYKLGHLQQQQKVLLSILSYLLFDMPQSPFMKYNTPQTPYPSLYGFKDRYFNLGLTFNIEPNQLQHQEIIKQKQRVIKQKQNDILQTLTNLVNNKIPNKLIQQGLIHLQANYYSQNGFNMIESILPRIMQNQSFKSTLNVTQLMQRLLKRYRKQNLFERLIQKHILNNKDYICLKGLTNYQTIQSKQYQRSRLLLKIQKQMSSQTLTHLQSYTTPSSLQDTKTLPSINPNQLQFFEDKDPILLQMDGIKIYCQQRLNGISLRLKSDVSDLSEDSLPFLKLFCKAFSKMGTKAIKENAYNQLINNCINQITLNYQTQKDHNDHNLMKIYIFLNIQFNDRHFQYGFNVLSGLIGNFNHDNIFALSQMIQKAASQCFHQLSQDIVPVHGKHLAASKSPFAFFQSPIFNSRSITSMAGDLRKVTNPKQILMGIKHEMQQIWKTMMQKNRLQMLLGCTQSKRQLYLKYLNISIKSIPSIGKKATGISIGNFPQQKWLKYFPNFNQQLCFQAFKFPFHNVQSASSLIYSSIVNRNIQQYNKIGGSFIYKGALISYIQGSRKKVLELQDFYTKIDQIDKAKRDVCRRFNRYTVKDMFQTGINMQQARHFKQALIATQKQHLETLLNQYILQVLKKGQSSILCLGPKLENYQPLMKKGWEIERPVDDLSLKVESYSSKEPTLRLEHFTKIC